MGMEDETRYDPCRSQMSNYLVRGGKFNDLILKSMFKFWFFFFWVNIS